MPPRRTSGPSSVGIRRVRSQWYQIPELAPVELATVL